MLLIYVKKSTNRIKYCFNLVFSEMLGVDYMITTDPNEFLNYRNAKISYASQPVQDELFFLSSSLLFETGITNQDIKVAVHDGVKVLFPSRINAALPFDPFAAVFYMVSRYEEYQPFIKDEFGRFNASESIAYKHGFLQKPVVNLWVDMVKKLIQSRFSDFHFPVKKFKFVPTIDVDNAFAYLHKGIIRSAGGIAKSLVHFNFKEIVERFRVLLRLKPDPYDSYEFLFNIHEKYNLDALFFILFADYSMYDKNVPIQNKAFKSLIKSIADHAEIGIHPSFASIEKHEKLKKEFLRLSIVVNKEIKNSRQHFLRLYMPNTYRKLIDLDILNDYTMGFATQTGFRAGICSSFLFYDLDQEEETKLRVHPFMFMDGTLRKYLKLKPSEAMSAITPLIDEVKAVKGTFISLWHNESLGTSDHWKGWHSVYENMVNYIVK